MSTSTEVTAVTYHFDPACPWTWRTSRWLVDVTGRLNLTLSYRAFELSDGAPLDAVPDQYRAGTLASRSFLRVVEAAHARHDDGLIARFYTAYGSALHDRHVSPSRALMEGALTQSGGGDYVAALDDEGLDADVAAARRGAQSFAGDDTGSVPMGPTDTTVAVGMVPSPSTRDILLDAATRLFAERGIDNVSVAEIVRAAGQRNASAVQYHIGNRDDVLFAVLARHVPAIAERRHLLLERARSTPDRDIRPAAEAIVRPVTEFAQRGWQERSYLQIGSELSGAIDRTSSEIQELMTQTDGYLAWDLLRERCPTVPADLWRVRREICIVFVGRAAADRARLLDSGDDDHGVLSDDRFVDNLVDMVIGAMTAPSGGA